MDPLLVGWTQEEGKGKWGSPEGVCRAAVQVPRSMTKDVGCVSNGPEISTLKNHRKIQPMFPQQQTESHSENRRKQKQFLVDQPGIPLTKNLKRGRGTSQACYQDLATT